jgi:hypothetical protein
MNHRDDSGAVFLFDALIAWARRMAYHRPMANGCSAMIAIRMKRIEEKSNDMCDYHSEVDQASLTRLCNLQTKLIASPIPD